MSQSALSLRPSSPPSRIRGVLIRHLKRRATLPVLPGAAAELMVLLGAENTQAKELSDVIHKDQALAAQVLRIANSPTYRGRVQIVSLQQAIARLGTRLISEVALSATMRGTLALGGPDADAARLMWQSALATGLFTKEIARLRRTNVESAFLCGLLHDVGAPIVLGAVRLSSEAISERVSPSRRMELVQEFGAATGIRVARAWKLPERVQTTIAHFRNFERAPKHRVDAAMVGMARAFADHILDENGGKFERVKNHPAVVELNLYEEDLERLVLTGEAIHETVRSVS